MAGIVPGDHVCATYGTDDEHQAMVARYAGAALARNERFLYFAHHNGVDTIRRHLEASGIDVDAGLARGQIEIRRIEHDDQAIDPEAMIAALQADRRRALHDGYSALSATAEMSWALTRPAETDAVVQYEREVSRVFAAADIVGLCQYDRRLFERDTLQRLVATHEFQLACSPGMTTTARRKLSISEREDGVLALSGGLDIDSSPYLAARLAALPVDGDLVLQTADLAFADVSGCRALVHAAEARGDGRRIVLPDASASLVRVLELCGWSSHEQLVLA